MGLHPWHRFGILSYAHLAYRLMPAHSSQVCMMMDQWRLLPGVQRDIQQDLVSYHTCKPSLGRFPVLLSPSPLENSCEHNFTMEDGQNIPTSWKMDRTPQN